MFSLINSINDPAYHHSYREAGLIQSINEEQISTHAVLEDSSVIQYPIKQKNYPSLFSLASSTQKEISSHKKSENSTQLKAEFADLTECWEKVVDYARTYLPLEGRLVMKSDGFVYIKVDDQYIHTLFPMLQLEEKGFKEPPYFRSDDAPGAHISVFYIVEHIMPEELGQTFHFELKQITLVNPSHNISYAVLQVESPELQQLRVKYGLSPNLQGYEFHISLAKRSY